MTERIFRELQQRLDKYSLGFPATDSGVEIKILKKLFSPADAELFLALSPKLETPDAIAQRTERPVEKVLEQLTDMAGRGLLFRLKKGGDEKYGAIPFVHGLFEFQVKRLDRDMAELMEAYSEEGFNSAMQDGASGFLRTIPVQRSVAVTHQVAAYEDACEILKNAKQIVVTDCICRRKRQMVGEGCGKHMEACYMFGSMGQYYLDYNMGRKVTLDEAIEILTQAQADGLVTQPATAQNPAGMCNCCGDCCGVLRSLNSHPKPAELVFSNYFAVVDTEECTGCEDCIDRCQMDAISMKDDQLAVIDLDRCIGCGLCVTSCPTEALQLEPKPAEKRRTPPKTSAEQMLEMARKRGVL